jgi:hypothetical protein
VSRLEALVLAGDALVEVDAFRGIVQVPPMFLTLQLVTLQFSIPTPLPFAVLLISLGHDQL